MLIIPINKTQTMQAYLTGFQIEILIRQFYLNEKNVLKTPRIKLYFWQTTLGLNDSLAFLICIVFWKKFRYIISEVETLL